MESINDKLNYNLNKGVTSNINFINNITKFLINDDINDEYKNNIIYRHNYIVKIILKILDSNYFIFNPQFIINIFQN